ncbi:MAG TPA: FGGY family carbohydrate kinase [Actinomycetes bacterium]|nr:FGGY family carbohydrate kinase [Actinomycetes bacterium]
MTVPSPGVLVGIDVGTTRVKAVATDVDLQVRGHHEVPTPWLHKGATAEVDPTALATAAMAAAAGAVREAAGTALAVGVTGMAETGVLLGGDGRPLAPSLAWYDPRADCEDVRRQLGDDTYRRVTGRGNDTVPSLPKLLWLRRHRDEARAAVRYLSVPEWAAHALGGDQVNELSLVSRTGLFDVPGKAPWADALAMLDAGPDFLGEIVAAGQPVGRVSDEAPEELRGAVLTVAGHDHQTAAYALGAAVDGVVLDSLGTAEALLRTVRPPLGADAIDLMAREGVTTGWGVVPGHLCLLAGLPTGISLERVGQLVGAATPAERIELGRQGLALDRSRTAMRLAATYHGVTLHDVDDEAAPALVWRVAVEDLIATAQHILGVMAEQVGPHGDVVVTGGWLHNPLVKALKEAQYGGFAPGLLDEPGAMGAAELAGVAADLVAPRWDTSD